MPPNVLSDVRVGQNACVVQAAKKREEAGGLGVLFPSPEGHHLSRPNFLQRLWDPAHRVAGGKPEWKFHTLRHFAARDRIDALVDVDAAAILGYSDTSFTRKVNASPFKGPNSNHV